MEFALAISNLPHMSESSSSHAAAASATSDERIEDRPQDITSRDHTPYAVARDEGKHAWWIMCKWVIAAGSQRLAHLALTRPSAASRRFSRLNLLLLSVLVAGAVGTNWMWHPVHRGPGIPVGGETPTGKGWWQVVQSPMPPSDDQVTVASVWWNPPAAMIAATLAGLTCMLLGMIAVWFVGRCSQRAVVGSHTGEPRLRCALQYSTAWLIVFFPAALGACGRVLSRISTVADWSMKVPVRAFDVPIVLVSLAGTLFWWFWLVRLGGTVPKDTRGSVGRFVLLWTPLLAVLFVGAGVAVVYISMQRITPALDLSW